MMPEFTPEQDGFREEVRKLLREDDGTRGDRAVQADAVRAGERPARGAHRRLGKLGWLAMTRPSVTAERTPRS